MIKHQNYFRNLATAVLLLMSSLSQGQILIEADTIASDCRDSYARWTKADKFVISSDVEYEESDFFAGGDQACLRFENIDFEKSMLVGLNTREVIVTKESSTRQS